MDKQVLLVALLGVLLVVAAVQAVQLAGIGGQAKAPSTTTPVAAGTGAPQASAPATGSGSSGLDSVPNMVGGC